MPGWIGLREFWQTTYINTHPWTGI